MIGSSFMFSMQCLTLAVLAGGNVADPDADAPSSEKAVVAFSVFLFLLYVRRHFTSHAHIPHHPQLCYYSG